MPRSDFQSFFRVLTQISPLLETLGWNILVMKYAFGGEAGKSLQSANLILKTPPEYGVPAKEINITYIALNILK